MKKHKSYSFFAQCAKISCIAFLVSAFCQSAHADATSDTFRIPAKNFQWKMDKQPSEKVGGPDAYLKVRDNVIRVDGKDLPARTYDIRHQRGNFLTLEWKNDTPIDLQNNFHEILCAFQLPKDIQFKDVVKMELGNSLDQWTQTMHVVTKANDDGLFTIAWDPEHLPFANAIIDLRKFDRIRMTIRMDIREEIPLPKDAPEDAKPETKPLVNYSVSIGDITLTKNNHWGEGYLAERNKKWHEWVQFIDSYKVDYSDSSAMLEPPVEGRLKTPLSLTVDGKPNAEIIMEAKDQLGVIENTAKELQQWVKTISGAELPILDAPGSMPVKIHLNDPKMADRYASDFAFLKDLKPHFGADGYLIKTEGNDIYIGGVIPKGVMNGMFRFLENNTSIIFARFDDDFGTVYDIDPNLKIRWGDGRDKPLTPFRGWRGGSDFWQARNGMNAPMRTEYGGRYEILGNFSDYLPNRPPYQVWVDGEYHKFGYLKSQVCLGHDSFDLIIEGMLKTIKENIDKNNPPDSINWVTEDNWLVCTCEECLRPITLPDGTVLKSTGKSFVFTMSEEEKIFRSNQFYMFANRLARELKKHYPKVRLQLLAYFFMEPAPFIKLEDNIQIIFAPLYTRSDFRNPIFAPSNKGIWKNRRELLAKKVPMELYEYYFHTPNAEVMRADIKDYVDSGFEHVGSEISLGRGVEGAAQRDLEGIEHWSFMRLCWNYEQSAESVQKYYLRRVYREAAPVMEKFYGIIKEKYYKGLRGQHGSTFRGWCYHAIFEQGHGETLSRELHDALPLVKNPISRILFGRFLRQYDAMFDEWQIRTKKKPAPVKPAGQMTIPEEQISLMKNQIMLVWKNENGFKHHFTTIEYQGKFIDIARFRFTPSEIKKDKITVGNLFRSKHMGSQKLIPLSGKISFKLIARTPFRSLPYFGVWGSGTEFSDPDKNYRNISGKLWEFQYLPTGEFVDLDDIFGFKWLCPKDFIHPKTGYLEFDIFDVTVQPMSTETELGSTPMSSGLDMDLGY